MLKQHYLKEKTFSIVILYNVNDSILNKLDVNAAEIDNIILVDNSSVSNQQKIEKLAYKNKHYIFNEKNLGIAESLNIGVKKALLVGAEFLLLLDQDSVLTENYIEKMYSVFSSYPNRERIAIVAPKYIDEDSGEVSSFAEIHSDEVQSVLITMTSGNFLPVEIFKKVGYFDSSYFIDYVDNEFCLRCKKAGYEILEAQNVYLKHKLGESKNYKFLNKTPISTNHPPLRRYYIFRNRVFLYKKYFFSFTKWILTDITHCFKEIVKIFLFEEQKFLKLAYIILGLYHGLIHKSGPHPKQK